MDMPRNKLLITWTASLRQFRGHNKVLPGEGEHITNNRHIPSCRPYDQIITPVLSEMMMKVSPVMPIEVASLLC